VDVSVGSFARASLVAIRQSKPRSIARRPMERHAEALIAAHETVDLSALTGGVSFTAHIPAPTARHAWSLHGPDQLALQAIIAGRKVKTAFEIGTFNGGTTRVIAESLPDDGQIWTLDLPPQAFDATQEPDSFAGADVGREYAGSPAEAKITQILHDSATFDPSPYAEKCDLVLVDGAHDYAHGLCDTRTAFRLVAPGGVILWDDFMPYWHGLVRGIYEAAGPRPPRRLSGSNLGVWAADL
jgi:predicted O-methyltransferase YrrM